MGYSFQGVSEERAPMSIASPFGFDRSASTVDVQTLRTIALRPIETAAFWAAVLIPLVYPALMYGGLDGQELFVLLGAPSRSTRRRCSSAATTIATRPERGRTGSPDPAAPGSCGPPLHGPPLTSPPSSGSSLHGPALRGPTLHASPSPRGNRTPSLRTFKIRTRDQPGLCTTEYA